MAEALVMDFTSTSCAKAPAHLSERLQRKVAKPPTVPANPTTPPSQPKQRKFLQSKRVDKPERAEGGDKGNDCPDLSAPETAEIPPPTALTPEQSAQWKNVVALFGEPIVAEMLSSRWQHRMAAATGYAERLADLPSGRHSAKVVEIYCSVLSTLAGDTVLQVYAPAVSLFEALLASPQVREVSALALQTCAWGALEKIVRRLGDSNARIRDASSRLLMAVAALGATWLGGVVERLLACDFTGGRGATCKIEFVRGLVTQFPFENSSDGNPYSLDAAARLAIDGLNSPNGKIRKVATSLVLTIISTSQRPDIFDQYFTQLNPGTLRQLKVELEAEFCDASPTMEADLRAQEDEDVKVLEEMTAEGYSEEQHEFLRRCSDLLAVRPEAARCLLSKQWKLRERFLKRIACRASRLFDGSGTLPPIEVLCCVLDVTSIGVGDTVPQVCTTAAATAVNCIAMCVSRGLIARQQVGPLVETLVSTLVPCVGSSNTTVSVATRECVTTLLATDGITHEMVLNGTVSPAEASTAPWRVQVARLTLASSLITEKDSTVIRGPAQCAKVALLAKASFFHANTKVRAAAVKLVTDMHAAVGDEGCKAYLSDMNSKMLEQVSAKLNPNGRTRTAPNNQRRLQTLVFCISPSTTQDEEPQRPSTIGAMTHQGSSPGGLTMDRHHGPTMSLKDRILYKKVIHDEALQSKKVLEQVNSFVPEPSVCMPSSVLRPASKQGATKGRKTNLVFS